MRVKNFLRQHPARVYALVVAVLGLVGVFVAGLPVSPILAVVAAVLALFGGEAVQRTENAKTDEAAKAEPPAVPFDESPASGA